MAFRRLKVVGVIAVLSACGAAVLGSRAALSFGGTVDEEPVELYTRSPGAQGACVSNPLFQCMEPMTGVLNGGCNTPYSYQLGCPDSGVAGCCIERAAAPDSGYPPNTPVQAICYYHPYIDPALGRMQALCAAMDGGLNGVWQLTPP